MDKIKVVSNRQRVELYVNKILYIERRDRKIELVCKNHTYPVNDSLENLSHILPESYVRCHTGYIVNLENVSAIHSKYILMDNGVIIPVGRAYKNNLEKLIVVWR